MYKKLKTKIILILCILPLLACSCMANDNELFNNYIKTVREVIKKNWQLPTTNIPQRVVAEFTVGKTGEIYNEKIIISSGDIDIDNSVFEALRKSNPLPPLPRKYNGSSVNINFTFDYKMLDNDSLLRRRTDSLLRN